ncbi:MAG: VWA domain-containing protein [Acidobacteria bacterium]|nr:VWA domain-containing protein [Acidobacteriota bacterium]
MRVGERFIAQLLCALLAAALLAPGGFASRAGARGAPAHGQPPRQQQTRGRRVDAQPAAQATPRVFENDVPQTVSVFQRETELPLSIAILVDVSGSQASTLPDEKEFALRFLDSILRPGKDDAAILSFTGETVLEQDLTKDRASLQRAIQRLRVVLPPTRKEQEDSDVDPATGSAAPAEKEEDKDSPIGWTSVWDAIWVTANEVTAQTSGQTRRAIILLSDGDDTLRRVSRDEAVEAAVKANTIVYSIGIEPDCHGTDMACKLDKKALRKVSEATGGRAFFPLDDEQLAAAFAEINQELRTQYLVAYSPTNKARDNTYRRIRIEIANPRLRDQKIKLTYREGYFAAPPRAAAPRRERAPQERLKRPPRRPKKR